MGARSVIVVVFYYLIKQFVEFGIGIVGASIHTNTRFLVSNTGENAHLEGNAFSTFLILVLFPDFLGQAFFALRFGTLLEELVEIHEILWTFISLVEGVL